MHRYLLHIMYTFHRGRNINEKHSLWLQLELFSHSLCTALSLRARHRRLVCQFSSIHLHITCYPHFLFQVSQRCSLVVFLCGFVVTGDHFTAAVQCCHHSSHATQCQVLSNPFFHEPGKFAKITGRENLNTVAFQCSRKQKHQNYGVQSN